MPESSADVDVVVSPQPPVSVEVEAPDSPSVELTLAPPPGVVEVRVPGPQGEPGPPGASGGVHVHVQSIESEQWVIDHGLGKYPSWVFRDTSGDEIIGEVAYPTLNRTTVTYDIPVAGTGTAN